MKINGIEIKPGMVILDEDNHIYIVFPTDETYKTGYAFVNMTIGSWTTGIPENIKTIYNPPCSTNICSGNVLWEKPMEENDILEVTMDEVAEMFGVKRNCIRIK